jgi:AAA family ATP:ADP antiporter
MTRLFSKIFQVRAAEKAPVFLAALFFFFVMAALMMLRPAREALGMQRGIDEVRWLFIGTAVVTLAVNPVFGWLVSRFKRLSFITATYVFFALSLVGFWGILVFAPTAIGLTTGQVFYVWFSVFNLFAVMVCWALLADRFSLEQSKRFFSVIAAGGTLGAIFGPWLSSLLAKPFGTPVLLLIAAGFLILAVAAAWGLTHALSDQQYASAEHSVKADEKAVIGGNAWAGFGAVMRSRYLLGIAVYIVILAIILTFIYFTRLQMVAALGQDLDMRTGIFARLDMITQITTLVLQLGITGFLMRRFGVSVTMALLPLTVLFGFIGLAIVGTLTMVVILDATAKAVQRAVMRPARETLFTVLNREDKYKAKAFIDTFVYRGGDVIGAQVEGLLKSLGLGLMALASLVIPMSIAWTFLGVWLGRKQIARAAELGLTGGSEKSEILPVSTSQGDSSNPRA